MQLLINPHCSVWVWLENWTCFAYPCKCPLILLTTLAWLILSSGRTLLLYTNKYEPRERTAPDAAQDGTLRFSSILSEGSFLSTRKLNTTSTGQLKQPRDLSPSSRILATGSKQPGQTRVWSEVSVIPRDWPVPRGGLHRNWGRMRIKRELVSQNI